MKIRKYRDRSMVRNWAAGVLICLALYLGIVQAFAGLPK